MTEVWKNIPGYDGFYEVSNCGRIRSYRNGRYGKRNEPRLASPCLANNGYHYVRLAKDKKQKNKKVSRLVAETFIPNPKNKPQVNHIDGDKENNRVENLEWCTRSENMQHASKIGLLSISEAHKNALSIANRGEGSSNSILCENDVIQIRNSYKLGCFSQNDLAEAYDVSQTAISKIILNKTWKHI